MPKNAGFVTVKRSINEARHIHIKNKNPVLGNAIPCFGYKTKTGVVRILVIFKHRPCSVTSVERSRRDLSNDKAEQKPILTYYQNTLFPLIFQDRPRVR